MTKPIKIYSMMCIKSTGEQVSMVTKSRILALLGHSVNRKQLLKGPYFGQIRQKMTSLILYYI